MSGTFMDKSFSVAMPAGKEYRDNWDATFGKKKEEKHDFYSCQDGPVYHTPPCGKCDQCKTDQAFGLVREKRPGQVELRMTYDPSLPLPAPIQEMLAEAKQKKEAHPAHAEHAPICCCGKDGTRQSCPADPDHRECSCCDSCHRDCLLPGSAMSRRSRR